METLTAVIVLVLIVAVGIVTMMANAIEVGRLRRRIDVLERRERDRAMRERNVTRSRLQRAAKALVDTRSKAAGRDSK